MLPFKGCTQEVLSLFFDKLYRQCRYQRLLSEPQIEEIEKLMCRKLKQPQLLFRKLIDRPPNNHPKKPEPEEQVPQLLGVDLMDILSVEEEVNHASNKPNEQPSFILSNLPLPKQNQPQIVQGNIESNLHLCRKPAYFDPDSESESSSDEEMRVVDATRALANKHCKYHLTGVYNNTLKQMNYTRTIRRMNMPFLLIKVAGSNEEFLLRNCHSELFIGKVNSAYEVVMEKERQAKNEC